jgi:hypothetical protein
MKIYEMPRGAGKTTKLIELAAERGGYIVCPTRRDVDRIMAMTREMKPFVAMPITMTEFLNRRYYARGIREFYMDDLDRCLHALTQVPVAAITLTKEESDAG